MRPQSSNDPAIQLVEALSDLGAAVVVAPSSDDWVDRFDQLAHSQRDFPLSSTLRILYRVAERFHESFPEGGWNFHVIPVVPGH